MAKNKTTETESSVSAFLKAIVDETKRKDCILLAEMIEKQTGLTPKMWGPSIVGFGSYHYKYESGREGDSMLIGFSPRAAAIAIYLSANFENREDLLKKLGKHKTDKGCIHLKKLADIDTNVLLEMIANHLVHIQKLYPNT